MDCKGTWTPVPVPDETGDLWALRCSGCGELLVVLRGSGTNFPPGSDLEASVREVLTARSGTR